MQSLRCKVTVEVGGIVDDNDNVGCDCDNAYGDTGRVAILSLGVVVVRHLHSPECPPRGVAAGERIY